MDVMHEILVSDEKFSLAAELREFLARLDSIHYCSYGSFLSAIHFQRSFKGNFEILVRDELEVVEHLDKSFEVDTLHGTVSLSKNSKDSKSDLKIKLVDATAKNEEMRQYLISHSDIRTVVLSNSQGHLEKIDVQVPRRGAVIVSLLNELGDDPIQVTSIIEKIIWSLENVGVAPLLRESRFLAKDCIAVAANKIEDLFVVHANKTASLLKANSTGDIKSISASDLKRLGRPYAALLRA